jgi:hypothetical protein
LGDVAVESKSGPAGVPLVIKMHRVEHSEKMQQAL